MDEQPTWMTLFREWRDTSIRALELHRQATFRDLLSQTQRLERVESKVDEISHALSRNRINGGGKNRPSAIIPNVYAQDLSRARVETAGKIALAVAVALILAAVKAL